LAAPFRLGLLVPSSNTCLEPVAAAMLPPDVSLHVSRVPVARIGLGDDERAQFDFEPMLEAARLLADARVSVVAWGGTSGSWLGIARDRELCRELEDELGVPATTSTLALLDAFEAYGIRHYGLAVPYTVDVADRIVEMYAHEELECSALAQLGISENFAFDQVPPEQIEALVAEAAHGAEAVAVVCTNLRAGPLVDRLEQSGLLVLDSVVATVWRCLELAGNPASLAGWGDLARNGSLRSALLRVLRELLDATGASRTTIRLELPARGLNVDCATAEAAAPGVRSILHDASLDQWAMPTVRWIAREKRILVQPDFSSPPLVSSALVEVYGVKAQMLHPLLRGGAVFGWISVHQVGETRQWSEADLGALGRTAAAVEGMLSD
jgi:maleate isomerase